MNWIYYFSDIIIIEKAQIVKSKIKALIKFGVDPFYVFFYFEWWIDCTRIEVFVHREKVKLCFVVYWYYVYIMPIRRYMQNDKLCLAL